MNRQQRFTSLALLWLAGMGTMPLYAADVKSSGNSVVIRPDGGQAKVIKLEVVNDNIIRVRATSDDELPVKPASLMVVPQTAPKKGSYTIADEGETIVVKAKNVKARVDKATGRIRFFDANGKELLKEAEIIQQQMEMVGHTADPI